MSTVPTPNPAPPVAAGAQASMGIGLTAGVSLGESTTDRIAREHKIICGHIVQRVEHILLDPADKAKADAIIYDMVNLLRHGPRTPDRWRNHPDQHAEIAQIREGK